MIKRFNSLKELGQSGLSELNNLAAIAKRFTDPNKLEEIYTRVGDTFSAFIPDLSTSPDALVKFFEEDVNFIQAWETLLDFPTLRISPIELRAVNDSPL